MQKEGCFNVGYGEDARHLNMTLFKRYIHSLSAELDPPEQQALIATNATQSTANQCLSASMDSAAYSASSSLSGF